MMIFRCTSVSRDNLSETRDGRRESEAVIHGTSFNHTLMVVIHGDGSNCDDTWSAEIRYNCTDGDDGKNDGGDGKYFVSRCVADSKCSSRSDGFCFHRLDA